LKRVLNECIVERGEYIIVQTGDNMIGELIGNEIPYGQWTLWSRGAVDRKIERVRPRLASWNHSDHPDQVRLKTYLKEVMVALDPLPASGPLYLHMEIDVASARNLLQGHDLENYLTPLFQGGCLPSSRFVLVSAHKKVGGGSRILCGTAQVAAAERNRGAWQYFAMNMGSGSKQKERLREALKSAQVACAPAGRVAVRLSWRCSANSRSWSNRWKPTGDAMGPVLGYSQPGRPYCPADDRITDLELHLNPDEAIGYDVKLGMRWRAA
jgi:hypothetical protein